MKEPRNEPRPLSAGTHTVRLNVKVVPGSSRDGIAGWLGDALKVRVSAPAEGGKANAAVTATLAAALGISERQVRLAAGAGSPRKIFEVSGLSEAEVRRRIDAGATSGAT